MVGQEDVPAGSGGAQLPEGSEGLLSKGPAAAELQRLRHLRTAVRRVVLRGMVFGHHPPMPLSSCLSRPDGFPAVQWCRCSLPRACPSCRQGVDLIVPCPCGVVELPQTLEGDLRSATATRGWVRAGGGRWYMHAGQSQGGGRMSEHFQSVR